MSVVEAPVRIFSVTDSKTACVVGLGMDVEGVVEKMGEEMDGLLVVYVAVTPGVESGKFNYNFSTDVHTCRRVICGLSEKYTQGPIDEEGGDIHIPGSDQWDTISAHFDNIRVRVLAEQVDEYDDFDPKDY